MSDEIPKDVSIILELDRKFLAEYQAGNMSFEKLSVQMMGTRNLIDGMIYDKIFETFEIVKDFHKQLKDLSYSKDV